MILTLLSGIHVDADVPVWTQTAVHLNDGSDRTALINEPGLGSSISLSEAKPQKKTFTRAALRHLENRGAAQTRGLPPAKFSNSPEDPSGALSKMHGIFSRLNAGPQLCAHIKEDAAHCKF